MTVDAIREVRLSLTFLPLAAPVSDAKVLTGRQMPLTEVALLFAEIETREGRSGLGFSYAKRAGGPGRYAYACEVAGRLIGEDSSDIARLWTKLVWEGASVGRSGRRRPGRSERIDARSASFVRAFDFERGDPGR